MATSARSRKSARCITLRASASARSRRRRCASCATRRACAICRVSSKPPSRHKHGLMKVTCYGHACFSVVAGGKALLFDPFISPNPLAKSIDVKRVPADYILVSHGHEDHLADAVEIARRTNATVIANFEVATWLG